LPAVSDIPHFWSRNVFWLHVLQCSDYPYLFGLDPLTIASWHVSFDIVPESIIWLMAYTASEIFIFFPDIS
jgi:hypothetical protein